jgi:hypothetical protein
MPLILKSYLEAKKNYYPAYDFFKDTIYNSIEPFQKARDYKYDSSNFILNIGKPLFILSIIILIDFLSFIGFRITEGKLNQICMKVNKMFRYGIYLKFVIMMHIELLVPAMLQILYVRYI